MSDSIGKNIIWNFIRVISNLLFPLITFPYVTRILGPYNLGLYNYALSIVGYFILFANLGFPLYGTREIARHRNDKQKIEKVVGSIFTANLLTVVVAFVLFYCLVISSFGDDQILFLTVGISILLNAISFEWFYQGIEDFKYITLRSILVKLASVVFLFLFVHDEKDLLNYAILNVVASGGNNFFNLYHLKKFTRLTLQFKKVTVAIKGSFNLFLGSVIISLYTYLNSIMLGAMGDVTAVGYYTSGDKFIQVALTGIASITTSVLPRMSYLAAQNDNQSTVILQKKVLNLIFLITIPLVAVFILFSDQIIRIFCGNEFMPSAHVLTINSLLIVIIPLSGFLGMQVLYPKGKEKLGNVCVALGAGINLLMNFLLIKHLSYIGVAISVVLAESVVTLSHYFFSKRYMKLRIRNFIPVKILFSTFITCIIIVLLSPLSDSDWKLFPLSMLFFIIYLVILYLLKENFVIELLNKIYQRYGKHI